jgi:hypothetical protein
MKKEVPKAMGSFEGVNLEDICHVRLFEETFRRALNLPAWPLFRCFTYFSEI